MGSKDKGNCLKLASINSVPQTRSNVDKRLLCMQIKHGLAVHISDEAYEQLRHLMAFKYDEDSDKYIRMELYSQLSHTGSLQTVSVPALPSLYAVNMKGNLAYGELDSETSEDGVACTVDGFKLADWILQNHDVPAPPDVDEKDWQPEDRVPGIMDVLLAGDGCRWQSSVPCTTMGIQAVGLREKGSKIVMAATHSVLVMEDHDSYHCFLQYGQR